MDTRAVGVLGGADPSRDEVMVTDLDVEELLLGDESSDQLQVWRSVCRTFPSACSMMTGHKTPNKGEGLDSIRIALGEKMSSDGVNPS